MDWCPPRRVPKRESGVLPATRAVSSRARAGVASQSQRADVSAQVNAQVAKMAALGCSGAYVGNIERDFHRKFSGLEGGPFKLEPWVLQVPLLNEKGSGWDLQPVHALAPHEMFAFLHGRVPSFLGGAPVGS